MTTLSRVKLQEPTCISELQQYANTLNILIYYLSSSQTKRSFLPTFNFFSMLLRAVGICCGDERLCMSPCKCKGSWQSNSLAPALLTAAGPMGALRLFLIDHCEHWKKIPLPTGFGQELLCTSSGVRPSLEQGSLYSATSLLHLFHISSSLITHPRLQSVKVIAHFPPGKLILICQCDRRGNGCVKTHMKE